MPKIEFADLPIEVKRHFLRRVRQRGAGVETISIIRNWIATNPEAPDGDWWKDFGDFKLVGTGKYPKSILEPDMKARGKELD